ncbi:MAG: bifunctional hydroxymethylpyrimidine kinase/phosphomethylpyrimidine kinase [Clostridioides sp.]|nr:bifunctional hydroxymethylpyrimidine kinase/phosphomethylpyrimidine kinase [Clostridioides sp.]
MKKVLTIAGSDSSGGAGIQADIKTITAHKMYAMSVITSLTAQNTTGVFAIQDATPEFVGAQLDAVFSDIMPDSVKIGMVSNAEIIRVIADKLTEYHAENIVVDPVMVSTSESKLLCDSAHKALKEVLLPLATLITPNVPEAESLSGIEIKTYDDMVRAADIISKLTDGAILVKGGHLENSSQDCLYYNGQALRFSCEKVYNPNTHGTGCTLSSAIACNLADCNSLEDSVRNAKIYLTGALKDGLDLGNGSGPLNHMYNLAQVKHK